MKFPTLKPAPTNAYNLSDFDTAGASPKRKETDMRDTETYHDFLRRMDAKVQSVTLHYEDDSVTVSGATLHTCYHDGFTWRCTNTLIVLREELVPNALDLFEQFATRKQDHETHKGNRKTYFSGLDILFADLVQG